MHVALQVVEWLIGVANHLPSEDQCQKSLVAPVDDKGKFEDIMLGRTKCYDVITKVGVNHSSYGVSQSKIYQVTRRGERVKGIHLDVVFVNLLLLFNCCRQRRQENRKCNGTLNFF